MRKVLKLVISFVLAFSVVGCSTEKVMDDKAFISNLTKGLTERWGDDVPETDEDSSTSEIQESFELSLDKEFESLGKFEDYTFEDEKLSNLAKQYFDALNLQKEGIKYCTHSNVYPEHDADDDYYDTYELGYSKRVVIINKINELYPLKFEGKAEKIFKDMLKEFEIENRWLQGRELMEEINKNPIELVVDQEKSDEWSTYLTCTLENTADYEFDQIWVDVDFLDEEGTIVEQTSDMVENVASHQKFKLSFYVDGDVNYSSYKTKLSVFYDR